MTLFKVVAPVAVVLSLVTPIVFKSNTTFALKSNALQTQCRGDVRCVIGGGNLAGNYYAWCKWSLPCVGPSNGGGCFGCIELDLWYTDQNGIEVLLDSWCIDCAAQCGSTGSNTDRHNYNFGIGSYVLIAQTYEGSCANKGTYLTYETASWSIP